MLLSSGCAALTRGSCFLKNTRYGFKARLGNALLCLGGLPGGAGAAIGTVNGGAAAGAVATGTLGVGTELDGGNACAAANGGTASGTCRVEAGILAAPAATVDGIPFLRTSRPCFHAVRKRIHFYCVEKERDQRKHTMILGSEAVPSCQGEEAVQGPSQTSCGHLTGASLVAPTSTLSPSLLLQLALFLYALALLLLVLQ